MLRIDLFYSCNTIEFTMSFYYIAENITLELFDLMVIISIHSFTVIKLFFRANGQAHCSGRMQQQVRELRGVWQVVTMCGCWPVQCWHEESLTELHMRYLLGVYTSELHL